MSGRYQEGYVAGHKKGTEDSAAEIGRLRAALEMIAGQRQCIDNLMSDKDIARRALEGK